jgi:hypothetical protein
MLTARLFGGPFCLLARLALSFPPVDATCTTVIAGHSRPKDGVAPLAYARKRRDPAIHEQARLTQASRENIFAEAGHGPLGQARG